MMLNPQVRSPLPTTGFHGTTKQAAQLILNGNFIPSRNPYDWLGDGVYFFQDAPGRAWEWARENHGSEAAVVGAELHLVDCIDMLDSMWTNFMTLAYDSFLEYYKLAGFDLPTQTRGAHRLDREVINYAIGVLAERGIIIRCVRSAFEEGHPVYPDSAFHNRSHIQIAIRDVETCITNKWLEDNL